MYNYRKCIVQLLLLTLIMAIAIDFRPYMIYFMTDCNELYFAV